jgi:shikimate kinase
MLKNQKVMKSNIVLLGYMGSGKSTIGRSFASLQGSKFVDLDNYIEKKEGMSVSKIFEKYGVIRFRKVEKQSLAEVLTSNKGIVIALGGGTPCYYDNMKLVNDHSDSVYLQMSVKSLTERLWQEKQQRPIIAAINERSELQEFIGKHLFERNHFYQQAQHSLLVDSLSVDEVLEKLENLLA